MLSSPAHRDAPTRAPTRPWRRNQQCAQSTPSRHARTPGEGNFPSHLPATTLGRLSEWWLNSLLYGVALGHVVDESRLVSSAGRAEGTLAHADPAGDRGRHRRRCEHRRPRRGAAHRYRRPRVPLVRPGRRRGIPLRERLLPAEVPRSRGLTGPRPGREEDRRSAPGRGVLPRAVPLPDAGPHRIERCTRRRPDQRHRRRRSRPVPQRRPPAGGHWSTARSAPALRGGRQRAGGHRAPAACGEHAAPVCLLLRTGQQRGADRELVGHPDPAGRPLVPGPRDRRRPLSSGRQRGTPAGRQPGRVIREPAQPLHHPRLPPAAGARLGSSRLAGSGHQSRRRAAAPRSGRLEGIRPVGLQGIRDGDHRWVPRQRVRDAPGCGERRSAASVST